MPNLGIWYILVLPIDQAMLLKLSSIVHISTVVHITQEKL